MLSGLTISLSQISRVSVGQLFGKIPMICYDIEPTDSVLWEFAQTRFNLNTWKTYSYKKTGDFSPCLCNFCSPHTSCHLRTQCPTCIISSQPFIFQPASDKPRPTRSERPYSMADCGYCATNWTDERSAKKFAEFGRLRSCFT